jgi:CBS domain-containing protein
MESALTETVTTVADAMHAGVISCSLEMPLVDVAALMARHQIHAVVVYDYGDEADEDRELYGIVSDRDIADAYAAAAVENRTARDSAGEPILAVQSDEELRRAAQLLAEHGVSHLVVTDPHTQRPVGVLSTLDLARSIAA